MKVMPTTLAGVLTVEPRVHVDGRGFFLETWHAARYRDAGIPAEFVQDNHSRSVRGTLRGLHYQIEHPQGKLVQVVSGEIFDVAVDLRRPSPDFGRWVGARLSAENHHQLWIPPGFAHGFLVTSESADVLYKCTSPYAPADERVLRWDDPSVGVEWPLANGATPLLSAKDAAGALLRDASVYS
jgi:dTDP-4-dehydrorhamnose 3,5-epimerase